MASDRPSVNYVAIGIEELSPGQPLPVTVYLSIEGRYVVFRAEGHEIDKAAHARLGARGVTQVFVREPDLQSWKSWVSGIRQKAAAPTQSLDVEVLQAARDDARRRMLDVFSGAPSAASVGQALDSSRRLVLEVMKMPYAEQTLSQLQQFSRGAVDHSVNVSVLGTYLAMHLGHESPATLQIVAAGGLLHDIGKARVAVTEKDSPEEVAKKMRVHPAEGARMLEHVAVVPLEVRRIVAQHHERFDGTGFPAGLRGAQIDPLAGIVSIANLFDELVAADQGALDARQSRAIERIETECASWFDPEKLESALRILSAGI